MDYVRHRYQQPEHFNIHKYPLLPQCLNVEEAETLKQQYIAYQDMLSRMQDKYERLENEESKITAKTNPEIMMAAIASIAALPAIWSICYSSIG